MRDGVSAAGSKRELIKRLWKSFFADPSKWWDYREHKRNPKAPDFQHKSSKEKLWLDGTRNPSWVLPLLEKKDKECPSFTLPSLMLETDKKETTAITQCISCVMPVAITTEDPNLKQKKKKMPAPSMEQPNLKQKKKVQHFNSGMYSCRTDIHAGPLKKLKKNRIAGEMCETCVITTKEPNLKQKKKMPTMEEPKKKKKMQFSKPGASYFRMETQVWKSKKMKKNYIIGELCDWHSLGLEDSIHALEKGLFSEPSIETLVYIVCKCTKHKDRDYALRLLAYLERNGLDSDKMLGNYVVSMLAEVESMPQAQAVFDKLVLRSERTWNTLIIGHTKSGKFQQALDLYKVMRRERAVHISGYTFVAMLKACTSLKDVKVGRLIRADAAREGLLKTNHIVGNALLDMFAKCGSLAEAQNVFDTLPNRSVITWSSLIAGYAQHERGVAALKCFQLMQDSGVSPNAFTFSTVLKACGSVKNLAAGIQVHLKVEQEGLLKTSQFVGNALVDMYAKCGVLTKAQEVFDLLPARDVISWNALITGYTEHAHFKEAIMCFECMQASGALPNGITFTCCLKACANTRAIEKGKEIHLEIAARGLLKKDLILGSSLVDMYAKCGLLEKAKAVFGKLPTQDAVAWTSLIAGYVHHDAYEEALMCFKQMQAKDVSLDAIAYAYILKACGSVGARNVGAEIHNEIDGKGLLKRELFLGNAVVAMYMKFGMLAKAHEVFAAIHVHDVVSWTALLTGYAQLGDVEQVFYIFDKMREEGVSPTSVTTVGILHACSNAGLVDLALEHIETMSKDYGITPTLEHYTCVIDLLGRIDQINRAAALVFKLPFQPNIVMWLALLDACQKSDNVKLARNAFEQVMLLDESEASAYICMYNIYADAGMHDEAIKLEAMNVKESMEACFCRSEVMKL